MGFKLFENEENTESFTTAPSQLDMLSIEEATIELNNEMLAIESMFQAMDTGNEQLEVLSRTLAVENMLTPEMLSDRAFIALSTVNFDNIKQSLGYVSTNTVAAEDMTTLSVEEKMNVFRELINGLKKLYLKVLAAIKKFFVNLVHNGKNLDAKLGILLKEAEDKKSTYTVIENELVFEKIISKFKTVTTVMPISGYSSALDLMDTILDNINNPLDVNSIASISADSITSKIKEIAQEGALKAADKRNSENAQKYGHKIDSDAEYKYYTNVYKEIYDKLSKESHTLYFTEALVNGYDNEFKVNNKFKIAGYATRYDGDHLHGVVVEDHSLNGGKTEFSKMKYYKMDSVGTGKNSKNANSYDDVLKAFQDKKVSYDDIRAMLKKIKQPSLKIKELIKDGEIALDKGNYILNTISEINLRNENGENRGLNDLITNTLDIIPKVTNANVINYHNNLSNIFYVLSEYIKVND